MARNQKVPKRLGKGPRSRQACSLLVHLASAEEVWNPNSDRVRAKLRPNAKLQKE